MAVAELGEHLDLCMKLCNTLIGVGVSSLDCDLCSVFKLSNVYVAEAADTNDGVGGPVLCCLSKLSKREVAAQAEVR
ncbi:hypothetical protein IEQ34_013553 [Dendrobium chrysotoxum]|uniref:Uncharacterized protein n=1 Tax=Dendrobium chrysotoxum TaxID=161865 RepID=A0AAV7GRP8_DENCH|nr:hypothetical protein IEQ34_013553 [Dendrobium chrysotoxum]